MKTSNILPEQCRKEIEDKLEAVKFHWKDKGVIYTEAFSGYISAFNWFLGKENSEVKEDRRQCNRQHAWGHGNFCLVCGVKHPTKDSQKSLIIELAEPEIERSFQRDSEDEVEWEGD